MRGLQKKAAVNPPVIAYVSVYLAGLLLSVGFQTFVDYMVVWNHRELARVTSPDNQVDAVFVEPIIGRLSKDSALYLVPKGEPPPASGPALRGTGFRELPVLVWKEPHLLAVNYSRGCIDNFSSLWRSEDIGDGLHYVEVQLNATTTLPCIGDSSDAPRSNASKSVTGG